MRDVNFMHNDNGRITILCDQLPDKGFIDAIKVKDIVSFQIKTKKEKAKIGHPGPDVDVQYVTGEKRTISRQQLISDFVHCNGKRIRIYTLRSGYKYYATSSKAFNETYKVIKMPDNCTGQFKGVSAPSRSYVVCKANSDGTPNKETMCVVSEKLFKKMFKIPKQDIIVKHMYGNAKHNKMFGLFNPNRLNQVRNRANKAIITNSNYVPQTPPAQNGINLGTGINTVMNNNSPKVSIQKRIGEPQVNIQKPNISLQKPGVQQQKPAEAEIKYKYTITHRIVSMTNNNLIGYVVKEISSGKSKQLSVQQVKQLCGQKLVDNVMLVTRDNGYSFLKGNNIRIENLPQVLA